jgi:AhpD family alkylhydroperoxidase
MTTTTDTQARRAAARVPLEVPSTMFGRLLSWYARRTYGEIPDTGLALLHHRPAMWAVLGFERRVDRWKALDPDLKILAEMASARMIGCSWCVDFGYYVAHNKGLDTSKLEEVQRWRESAVFTDLERDVLQYAEAMTATPPTVTDELAERLRSTLGTRAFVELTMMVAIENERSRLNSALGLRSQGYKDLCELPRG